MNDSGLLDRTVSSLYETVLDPGHWPEAIANMAGLFTASAAAMFEYDFELGMASNARLFGHDAEAERLYMSHYHQLDPGRSVVMSVGVGHWLADEAIFDLRARQHQAYVQDFALRNGIGQCAGVKLTGDSRRCVYLGLQRRPGAPRFGEQGLRTFSMVGPHLRRVAQMRARIDSLAAGAALGHACLDRLRAAVVVVDKTRRVIFVNSHGQRLLGSGNSLRIDQQRLLCGLPTFDETLARAVSAACGAHRRGGALRLPQQDAQSGLLVSVLPVPLAHELASTAFQPLALVAVGEPGAAHVPAEVYRELFTLTSAEAALLCALVRGVSLNQWAEQRGISITTARTQLAALFEKSGVDSQARLVGLAKTLPPFV